MKKTLSLAPRHLEVARSFFRDIQIVEVRTEPVTDSHAQRVIARFEEGFNESQGSLYCRVHGISAFEEIKKLGGWVVPHIREHFNTTSGDLRRAWQMILSEISG